MECVCGVVVREVICLPNASNSWYVVACVMCLDSMWDTCTKSVC